MWSNSKTIGRIKKGRKELHFGGGNAVARGKKRNRMNRKRSREELELNQEEEQ